MAQEKRKSQIPTNSNFSDLVIANIEEIKKIEQAAKTINYASADKYLKNIIELLTEISIILTKNSDLNKIIIFLQQNNIKPESINNIFNLFNIILDNITTLFTRIIQIPNPKKVKFITTGILNFLLILISMVKIMSSLIISTPILTGFISLQPIIYNSMEIAFKLLNDLSTLAILTLKRSISLKLFGLTSKLLINAIEILITVIWRISILTSLIKEREIKDMLQIWLLIRLLQDIFDQIHKVQIIFLIFHLKKILKCVIILSKIINIIRHINTRGLFRVLKDLLILKLIIYNLIQILTLFILSIPLAILFIILSPMIILSIWTIGKILNLLGEILNKTIGRQAQKGIIKLAKIILILLSIMTLLIILGMLASQITSVTINNILLFMTGIIVFVVMLRILTFVLKRAFKFKTIESLILLSGIILLLSGIAILLINLSLISIILSKGILLIIGLILFMIGFVLLLRIFTWIVAKTITIKVVMAFILLTGIITMLFAVTLMIVVLSIMSIAIISNLPSLMIYFLALIGLVIILGIIGFIISKIYIVLIQAVIGLTLIATMILILTTVTILLLLMSLMVNKIMSNYNNLLLYLLGLIPLLLIITIIGNIVFYAMPIIIPAIIGLALVLVMISVLTIISLMLVVIQNINLNSDLIHKNITIIFDTLKFIIEQLFIDDNNKNESDKGFITTVISKFANGMISILTAIMAVAFLALAIFSILMILFLATELRLLQTLDLDSKKIINNVNIVINTAFDVINSIFDPKDDKNNPSNRSFFGKIFDFFGMTELADITDIIFSIAFLALAVISITLIVGLAMELRLLQVLNLDPKKIINNVHTIINTAQSVSDAIFDPKDDKNNPSNKSFLGKIFDFFGMTELSKISDAIFSIAFLALSIISITLVLGLAAELNKLQNIKLNASKIQSNVDTVIKAAQNVSNAIYQKDETTTKKSKSIFGPLLDWLLPNGMSEIIDAITSIAFLASALVAINLVVKISDNLVKIAKLPNLSAVNKKTKNVIIAAQGVMNALYNKQINITDEQEEKLNKLKITFGTIDSVLIGITKIQDGLINIARSKMNAKQTKIKITEIFDVIRSFADENLNISRFNQNANALDRMIKIFKNFGLTNAVVQNTKHITENCIKFLDKIDSTKFENLKTAEKLFRSIAEFSKSINGNFDGLANTINEKIAPLIEELKKLLEDLPKEMQNIPNKITIKSDIEPDTNNLSIPFKKNNEHINKTIDKQQEKKVNLTNIETTLNKIYKTLDEIKENS